MATAMIPAAAANAAAPLPVSRDDPAVPSPMGGVWEGNVFFPESDGRPMSDNTVQQRWIITIQSGLEILFKNDPDVFVAGDLLWYPDRASSQISAAPDVLVAVGRPKGERGSYQQWREGGTPPQVVFEVLSPSNRLGEMLRKRDFYDRYGVEEYYLYDPDRFDLTGWLRSENGPLQIIENVNGWVSPRLGIRFEVNPGADLVIYRADGRRFPSIVELDNQREQAERERDRAERERDEERQKSERLAARLRDLGVDPDTL